MTHRRRERVIVAIHRLWALCLCLVTGAGACGEARRNGGCRPSELNSAPCVDLQAFQQIFTVVDRLVLEERDNVVTTTPNMFMDPHGGFLIADPRADQVRLYSRTGELEDVFGAGTGRADSLRYPYCADRLANGDIIAAPTLVGGLAIIPTAQEESTQYIGTPILRLFGVRVLDERRILLIGRNGPYPSNLLHIWDLPSNQIVKSFFSQPKHLDSTVVHTLGFAQAWSRGDKIAAIHRLSDTLFVFDRSGTELTGVPIPVDTFMAPEGRLPNISSMAERQRWIDQFTFMDHLFWIDDDELIVQWVSGSGVHIVYGLVQMNLTGQLVWTLTGTPRLLGFRDAEYFFDDPNSDAPNQLIIAAKSQ